MTDAVKVCCALESMVSVVGETVIPISPGRGEFLDVKFDEFIVPQPQARRVAAKTRTNKGLHRLLDTRWWVGNNPNRGEVGVRIHRPRNEFWWPAVRRPLINLISRGPNRQIAVGQCPLGHESTGRAVTANSGAGQIRGVTVT